MPESTEEDTVDKKKKDAITVIQVRKNGACPGTMTKKNVSQCM